MRVIALHGDFASGRILRRDTGISEWEYPNWKRDGYSVGCCEVFVGYSRGGSEIGWLSNYVLGNIRGAVIYESPLLEVDAVGGDFPILWIENDRGRRSLGGRFATEMQNTLAAWLSGGRQVTILRGHGRHVEPCLGFPPMRHGWDRSLNGWIMDWIANLK